MYNNKTYFAFSWDILSIEMQLRCFNQGADEQYV